MDTLDTIGKVIRTSRKRKGLTQEELAKMVNISTMSIRRYERDERIIPKEVLNRIMNVLGDSFHEAMTHYFNASSARIEKKLAEMRARDEEFIKEADRRFKAHVAEQTEKFISSPIGRGIIDAFYDLNEYGQEEALDRIIELSFLPQFSRDEIPDGLEEYVDAYLRDRYSKKYPPEGQETASDGQEEGV